MNSVRASAPATVANVCCGFDVLGFAVESPADEVVVSLRNETGIMIKSISGDNGRLPSDPLKNTASVAVQSYLNRMGSSQGVEIELIKKLPLGSGMGSSAASAVAALIAINHLMGNPLSRKELIVHAMEAERIACGSAHADNVAPSLLGGFVLIRSYEPLDVINVSSPEELYCTLIHPHLELKTEDSRKVLKSTVSLSDAVSQSGNIAALMIGLMQQNYALIGRSLFDVIAEPTRSVFIPGFNEIRKKVIDAGALGFGISGSGPTVFALSSNQLSAEQAGKVAAEHFMKMNLPAEIYISKVNQEGAKILS
ncbi:MAG: homoserine kinase [Cyclobacteriaceae bacterium]|nr:homoserine kinase [Cyclobacteriaceae bacterium]